MPKYSKLSVDGVIGDIYDESAVHNDDVINTVLEVLNAPEIRTALLNMYHPIGSYYFTDRNVNPGIFLGGTWTNVEGRFLVGASSAFPVNSEGGYTDAMLPRHKHDFVGDTLPNHNHTQNSHNHTQNSHNHSQGSHRHKAVHSGDSENARFLTTTSVPSFIQDEGSALSGSGYYFPRLDRASWARTAYTEYATASNAATTATNIATTATNIAASAGKPTGTITYSGDADTAGKNLPPYKAAYIWVRTA